MSNALACTGVDQQVRLIYKRHLQYPVKEHGLLQSQIQEIRLPNRLATLFPYLPTQFCIIGRMSENYQSKRERWQRLLESLPAGLREHVSIRNVEAVAALPQPAQARLSEAIRSGLKRLPRALEQLRDNPDTSVADLLKPPAQFLNHPSPEFNEQTRRELADLIQMCFPDMPRLSAESLAGAEVMELARQTAQVHHNLFQSHHLRTDFMLIVLYALLHQTLERLEAVIAETPAVQQTIHQSALPWKPNQWRTQDA